MPPPPPNIEEVPPAERPEGQQFVWIPGYWSWDADRDGYIWVSACWRMAPPRRSWVPGYWFRVSKGWEWVAGFWTPAGVREIEYLPAPPTFDDLDPYGPAPHPDAIWVPPCMYWVQDRYIRRAGYWLAAQPDWVWVPSHYIATPRGYVFAEGYWDYVLEQRGVLFAPVYFPKSVHGRLHFTYSPSIVVDLGALRINLFAYPRYSHYYFGDYYDEAYLRVGIYPWFDSPRLRTWYDPIFQHDRWQHVRSEPRREERARGEYDRRRADKDLRPARTYREQESRRAQLREPPQRVLPVAAPMSAVVAGRKTPLRFERIGTDARQKISREATAVGAFRDERRRWESTAADSRTARPPKEGQDVAAPSAERHEVVRSPVKRVDNATGTAPAREKDVAPRPPTRDPAFVPPREIKVTHPERVQIPLPPVVGATGAPGIFRNGPPALPPDEDKDDEGGDIHKGKAPNKDARRDKDDRKDH